MFHPLPLNRRDWLCISAAALVAPAAHALAPPREPVLLSLGGKIGRTNRGDRALFDMAMLAALPQRSTTQKTPWYAGPHKFTGPLLRDVLAAADARGDQIEAIAINDYKVTIPVEDCHKYPVLLTRLVDDQPISLRDKGPLLIVYPFDEDERLRTSIYYARSVWQLKALEIR